jgi:hypothetical protein
MEKEKSVLIIVIAAIVIVAVVLGVLIVSEQNNTGRAYSKVRFVGSGAKTFISTPIKEQEVPPELPVEVTSNEPTKTEPCCGTSKVIILPQDQLNDFYQRAEYLVMASKCYEDAADFRAVTFKEGMTGEKSVQGLLPNDDYSVFSGFIVLKLLDLKGHRVYYEEVPVTVDLARGKVIECGKSHFDESRFI